MFSFVCIKIKLIVFFKGIYIYIKGVKIEKKFWIDRLMSRSLEFLVGCFFLNLLIINDM